MIRIILFGTPEFANPSLGAIYGLQDHPSTSSGNIIFKLIAVVTALDKPIGRKQILTPPPVKVWAEKHGIPVLQPERIRDPEWVKRILDLHADLGVIAAYGQIIPKEIIEAPKYGVLNVHPSLLPRWRGPSPIQYAILAGDNKTGVTIMLTDAEMDHGPILAQERIPIESSNTGESLTKKLAVLGGKLLKKTVPKWIAGEIMTQPQDHAQATYSKMLTREDGRIDWKKSAEEIERQVRAFYPWPGTYTALQSAKRKAHSAGIKLKIIKTEIIDNKKSLGKPGQVLEADREEFEVQCGPGILRLITVQPEGKNPMPGAAFLRGHKWLIGRLADWQIG